MSKSKKYDFKITKESNASWSAAIVRQISSTKSNISKSQSHFKTKTEAKKWAESELKKFTQAQAERNIRKNEQRKTNQEQREDRSKRKAAKTAAAKAKSHEDDKTEHEKVWSSKTSDSANADNNAE